MCERLSYVFFFLFTSIGFIVACREMYIDWRWRKHVRTILESGGSIVWCPGCREQLNGKNAKPFEYDQHGFVVYSCTCGRVSRWLFDAPCPLLMEAK